MPDKTPREQHGIQGRSYGDTALHKFGHNSDVGTSYETIWTEGGDRTFRTTEAAMTISSASANDDSRSGTGALTVEVFGVDGNWDRISEVATMNGTSGVTLANNYMVVDRMVVLTAGSGNQNDGIIYVGTGTITAGKPAVVECLVAAGENQSEVCYYAIPQNTTFALTSLYGSEVSTLEATISLFYRPDGGVFNLKYKILSPGTFARTEFDPTLLIPGKGIIQVRALVSATSGDVSAGFGGYILAGKHA